MTLSQAAQGIDQDACGTNCESQFPQEHEIILRAHLTIEPVLEKDANTAPENDGLSSTAQEDAVHP